MFQQLAGEIMAGRYTSGEGLPAERALAEVFHVNRHVVREALKRLEQVGPLFARGFDSNYINATTNGDLIEFVQVKYAPSGDIWASFVKEMCPGGMTTACTWALSGRRGPRRSPLSLRLSPEALRRYPPGSVVLRSMG